MKKNNPGCNCCCPDCEAEYYNDGFSFIEYEYNLCITPANNSDLSSAENTHNQTTIASMLTTLNAIPATAASLSSETIDGVLYQTLKTSKTDSPTISLYCKDYNSGSVVLNLFTTRTVTFGARWLAATPCRLHWFATFRVYPSVGSKNVLAVDMEGGVGPRFQDEENFISDPDGLANICHPPDAALTLLTLERLGAFTGVANSSSNPFYGTAVLHNTYGTSPGTPTAC